jgi:hypothetical protein
VSEQVELTPLNAADLLADAKRLDACGGSGHEEALRAQLVKQMLGRHADRAEERAIRRKPERVPRPQRNSPFQPRKIGMSHRQERLRTKSPLGIALSGQLVAVRQRKIIDSTGPAAVYDLVIQVGKGKKHAREMRARIEEVYRQILAEMSQ